MSLDLNDHAGVLSPRDREREKIRAKVAQSRQAIVRNAEFEEFRTGNTAYVQQIRQQAEAVAARKAAALNNSEVARNMRAIADELRPFHARLEQAEEDARRARAEKRSIYERVDSRSHRKVPGGDTRVFKNISIEERL